MVWGGTKEFTICHERNCHIKSILNMYKHQSSNLQKPSLAIEKSPLSC
jgi:hypothetical protein